MVPELGPLWLLFFELLSSINFWMEVTSINLYSILQNIANPKILELVHDEW